MNKDLPPNPFRTPRLQYFLRLIMNWKKCMTHKKRGRFLLWSDKNYWDARKIIDTRWRLHFAELLKGAYIDQILTPNYFFSRIYLSMFKALIISGRRNTIFFSVITSPRFTLLICDNNYETAITICLRGVNY